KSANIVGSTMKLNPHGDAAIYDTMVRLSKGHEALLTPFVDSKGNFGKHYSRDMAWAAPRYTEAKLAPICSELFRDIDKDTVDMADNYDGSMLEPTLLPTSFPNVLVSANMGIAVGMASQICGFNLSEVCETTISYLNDPNHDLLSTLPAPDFPTGGEVLCNVDEMRALYSTGRGSVKVRARWRYLPKENMIEVYEIPYSTTAEQIMDKVAELLKSGNVREICDMRDETDLSGLKLTIDLKRGTDPDKLMAKLFKQTQLEDSFSCNFNILVDGTPRVMGVREIIEQWARFRIECVRRRTAFTRDKRAKQLHLLEGLQKILLDIDKAIKIIRETDEEADVVPNLMIGFGIDKVQAEYVAEIKLRHLNREFILKRTRDIEKIREEIALLDAILESKSRIKTIIIKELKAVMEKYGEERKTKLLYLDDIAEEEVEEEIPDYPVTVFFTGEGYFKKITPLSLRMASDQKLKEGDRVVQSLETTNAKEVLFFTDKCQVYKARISDFQDSKASVLGDYVPSALDMEPDEKARYMVVLEAYKGYMLFAFGNGKLAKVEMSAYETKSNRKKLINAFSAKAELTSAMFIPEDKDIVVVRDNDKAMLLSSALIPSKATKSTGGIQVYNLKKNSSMTKMLDVSEFISDDIEYYRSLKIPGTGHFINESDRSANQL
ncbi:MAG: topoisomerase IV, partial [Firmicutes bacterium]|nr:topoisomerase IV [Bacillota bacterium]